MQAKKICKEDLITNEIVYLNKYYKQNLPLLKANPLFYNRDVFQVGYLWNFTRVLGTDFLTLPLNIQVPNNQGRHSEHLFPGMFLQLKKGWYV